MFKFLEQEKKDFTGLKSYTSEVYIKNKDQRFKEVCDYILKNQPSISKAQIENELKALIQNEMKMVNDDWQTELKILRPWSHFRRFPENEDYVKHITDILMTMVFRNTWKLSSKELEIRPALGHVGDKFTAPVQKNPKLLNQFRIFHFYDFYDNH